MRRRGGTEAADAEFDDGTKEPWLLLFKNETHNHPTEIEPFGGAIRDPLSGRACVHQAMRITGGGDPRQSLDQSLPGKLPQIRIARDAAEERKPQRLFRRPEAAQLIKRYNDFGAVIIAVISAGDNAAETTGAAHNNGMRHTAARGTAKGEAFLRMKWRGKTIVELSRAFLDTNGAPRFASALRRWFFPGAERNREPPECGMAALLPSTGKQSRTASFMSFGFNPDLTERNP